MTLTFFIPGQPQGKGRARVGKVGGHARLFTPAKTAAYEGLVAYAARAAMNGDPLLDGPCRVVMRLDCQIPASWSKRKAERALAGGESPTTKPDLDNTVKAVFDGCNGVVWRDDVQVTQLACSKRYGATPGVAVEVHALCGPSQTAKNAQEGPKSGRGALFVGQGVSDTPPA